MKEIDINIDQVSCNPKECSEAMLGEFHKLTIEYAQKITKRFDVSEGYIQELVQVHGVYVSCEGANNSDKDPNIICARSCNAKILGASITSTVVEL